MKYHYSPPRRYKFPVLSLSTFLLAVYPSPATAFILEPAKSKLDCIISKAGASSNTVVTSMPFIIFNGISLLIFGYLIVNLISIFQAVKQGEESTQLITTFVIVVIGIVMIMAFQKMLLGDNTNC